MAKNKRIPIDFMEHDVYYCRIPFWQFHHRSDERVYAATAASSVQLHGVWSISGCRACRCYCEPEM